MSWSKLTNWALCIALVASTATVASLVTAGAASTQAPQTLVAGGKAATCTRGAPTGEPGDYYFNCTWPNVSLTLAPGDYLLTVSTRDKSLTQGAHEFPDSPGKCKVSAPNVRTLLQGTSLAWSPWNNLGSETGEPFHAVATGLVAVGPSGGSYALSSCTSHNIEGTATETPSIVPFLIEATPAKFSS